MKGMAIVCVAFIILLTVFPVHGQQKKPGRRVHLEGYVYDSKGNLLPGVDVGTWVVGNAGSVGGGTTGNGKKRPDGTMLPFGKYSFDIAVQGPFDVTYSMTGYRSSVVENLAEKQGHQISKILYRTGEKMPASDAQAYVHSVDRISFLALLLPGRNERRKFLSKFPEGQSDWVLRWKDEIDKPEIWTTNIKDPLISTILKGDARRAAAKLQTAWEK